jgi:hypothetical protein
MRAIVYNNQAQADTLKLRLKNKVKHLFKGVTNEYTYTIEHPTNSNVAVVIEESGKYWDDIYAELNPNDINLIETLTEDWFPQEP